MLKSSSHFQRGVTLIEMIIAIVIIGIAAVALLQGLGQQTRNNVDPMIQSQAQMLARQYLEEVSSKSFFDPTYDPRLVRNLSNSDIEAYGVLDQTRSGSPSRIAWNNIYEYDDYDESILDINGNAISGLSGYQIEIDVDVSEGLSLGSLSNSSAANCPPIVALIEVTITDPRDQITTLSGYRASYWDPGC